MIGLGYASAKVMDSDALVANLKTQLEDLNVDAARYKAKENAERIKLQNVTAELKEFRGLGKKTKRIF